eukprot:Rhum_TRINITY_DN20916_c0_g1::Rhum_TRINITY_DN20916_c0_g1_i1::g.172602::m.172602/K14997/SLC38A11; solute carrier family 38 (sodium-coupled neutral amino acid transporter), member 11
MSTANSNVVGEELQVAVPGNISDVGDEGSAVDVGSALQRTTSDYNAMEHTPPPPLCNGAEVPEVEGAEKDAVDGEAVGSHEWPTAVANFVNSVIGAGIIGLPFSIEEGGLFLSLGLLVLCGLMTAYSVKLIIRLGDRLGVDEYEQLCCMMLGKPGFYAISYSMLFFAYGAMLSYLILIGDTMAPVLGNWTGVSLLGSRYVVILLCAVLICLPLSSFRDIGALGKTSGVSIVCVFAIVALVCARSFSAADETNITPDYEFGWLAAGVSPTKGLDNATFVSFDAETACRNVYDRAEFGLHMVGHSATPGQASLNVTYDLPLKVNATLMFLFAVGSKKSVPDKSCIPLPLNASDIASRSGIVLPDEHGSLELHPHASVRWSTEHGRRSVHLRVNTDYSRPSKGAFRFMHSQFFPALGVISFAYVCHHSAFLVRNSLRNRDEWPKVVNISIFIATSVSLLLCCFGYLAFRRCTRPDILNNFEHDDQVINVARLLLAFTMFFTYPMEFFVVRQALTSLLYNGVSTTRSHWILTLFIFASTLPPGLLLKSDQLGLVLEFTGGIAASLLGFIMPGLLWLVYTRYSSTNNEAEKPPVEEEMVECSSTPHVVAKGAGMGLPAGGGPRPTPWPTVLCNSRAIIPVFLFVGGVLCLFFNSVLGVMHAAGIGTYEYPEYCPDTGV